MSREAIPARRFRPTDFPGAPDWFSRFLAELSSAVEAVASSLRTANAGVQLTYKPDSFAVPADAVENAFPRVFSHGLAVLPREVRVAHVENLTLPRAINVSGLFVTWELTQDGHVVVRYISGLTAGHSYRLLYAVQG